MGSFKALKKHHIRTKGIFFKDREACNFLLKLKVLLFCSSSSYVCVFLMNNLVETYIPDFSVKVVSGSHEPIYTLL